MIKTEPYNHLVIDSYLKHDEAEQLLNYAQLLVDQNKMDQNNHLNSKKIAQHDLNKFSKPVRSLIEEITKKVKAQVSEILEFKEEEIIDDLEYNHGGGFHCLPPGGFLNMHIDFNYHPISKNKRIANAIIYLNKEWKEEFGGTLILHKDKNEANMVEYSPIFNRLVVFPVTDKTWHGNPNPVKANRYRYSYSMYFYINEKASNEKFRTTVYKGFAGKTILKFKIWQKVKKFIPKKLIDYIKKRAN